MKLYLLKFKVALQGAWENLKVIFRYYRYRRFRKNDLALFAQYLFRNPFKISKQFCQKRGDAEIYVYGETPLTILDKIFQEAGVSEKDVVFDLGAGRGRACFWLNGVIGCKAIGIEEIPEFVARAKRVAKGQTGLEFRFQDMVKADLTGGTLFYLYGNFLSEDTLKIMAKKFEKLPAGTRVISVSFPITDYSPAFRLVKAFPVPFPWGWADVYLSSLIPEDQVIERKAPWAK